MIDPTITVYAGARTSAPAQVDTLTWSETIDAVRELLARDPVGDKLDVLAIAPHRLRDGATRNADAVEAVTALVLDVDHADLAALDRRLRELGVAAIVYGSPSDDATQAARRVRVVAPVTREIAPAECDNARLAFAERLGLAPGCGVEGALGPERLFFAGRAHRDEKKQRDLPTTPREMRVYDGAAVDVDALPAPSLAWSRARHLSNDAEPKQISARAHDPVQHAAWCAVLAALGPIEALDGRKHDACGAVGGLLRKAGWTRNDAGALVRAWIAAHPAAGAGVDVDAGVRWALGAWDEPAESVSGRARLDAIVGERAGAAVEAGAMLPWNARRGHRAEIAGEPAPIVHDAGTYATLEIVDTAHAPPPLHFVVPGLDLAVGKVSAIQGFANAGKTPFALALALSVAAGTPFLGFDVIQTPVVYFDFEGGPLTHERLARIAGAQGVALADTPITLARCEALSDLALAEIEELAIDRKAGVIVVDTYTSALPPEVTSFNDAAFRSWATRLGRVATAHDALALCLVHENKGAHGGAGVRGISGHGSLAGGVQTSIALAARESDDKIVDVCCARRAKRGFAPFAVRWTDPPCADAPGGEGLRAERVEAQATAPATRASTKPASAERAVRIARAGERIARNAGVRWQSHATLARLGGEGPRVGADAIARLLDAGIVVQDGAGSYAVRDVQHDAADVRAALGAVAGFTRA